ncbi:MAG: hypothetical protein COB61_004155 [Thiotrichales bacterium]|nr:hypothetical protein [Thiotrichales bacterium]
MSQEEQIFSPNAKPDLWNRTVASLSGGSIQLEMSDLLAEAVEAMRKTNKKAEVGLTLIIKPLRNGAYQITPKIIDKLPEEDKGCTIMFGTPDGNLQRNDPNQSELPLRGVEASASPAMRAGS